MLPYMAKTLAEWYRRSNSDLPIENHFRRVSRAHCGKALLVVVPRQAGRDDWRYIQARLEHHRHQIPGLVHLAAVDALNGDHIENDFAPIEGERRRGNPQHGDLAAMAQIIEH